MSVTRERFVAEARRWIGVPWVHQGRSRHGVDCIGLLLVVCRSLGLSDYEVTGYGTAPNADFMRAECDRLMTRVAAPEIGDVILFRLSRNLLHAMIWSADRRVIHAWAAAGHVVEVGFPVAWLRRVAAAYRVPGVT